MDPISYDLVEAAVRRLTLDPYSHVPRFLLVVDADALLSSIDNHCRSGTPTRLLRIAASIGSRVYASEHVLAETYAGFPKLSSRAASASALPACFEQEYLQLIRWATIDPAGVTDERVDQSS